MALHQQDSISVCHLICGTTCSLPSVNHVKSLYSECVPVCRVLIWGCRRSMAPWYSTTTSLGTWLSVWAPPSRPLCRSCRNSTPLQRTRQSGSASWAMGGRSHRPCSRPRPRAGAHPPPMTHAGIPHAQRALVVLQQCHYHKLPLLLVLRCKWLVSWCRLHTLVVPNLQGGRWLCAAAGCASRHADAQRQQLPRAAGAAVRPARSRGRPGHRQQLCRWRTVTVELHFSQHGARPSAA